MGKGAGKMKMEVLVNGRAIPKAEQHAVLKEVSDRMRQRQEVNLVARRMARTGNLPNDRQSIARAMLLVELKIVKALWVLQRAMTEDAWNYYPSRHGVDYLMERVDHFMAGHWQHVAPRPAVPEGKHIDEAGRVQGWLGLLQPSEARILTVGAMSKRGDAGRRINWMRVKARLPELENQPIRTLQATYSRALRHMVAELALRGIN
jgi:hypothetical protein